MLSNTGFDLATKACNERSPPPFVNPAPRPLRFVMTLTNFATKGLSRGGDAEKAKLKSERGDLGSSFR